jgi:hypothetical protein
VVVVAPARKECQDIKRSQMKHYNRELLVLYKAARIREELLEHEVECLHQILIHAETEAVFSNAHELVLRNRITRKPQAILKVQQEAGLKPFNFLLNKN